MQQGVRLFRITIVTVAVAYMVKPMISFRKLSAQKIDSMAGQGSYFNTGREGILGLLFAMLLITGCHKEHMSVSALLQSNTWLTSDVQLYGAGYQGESAISICNLDNTIRFSPNGTVLFDYGTVTCDPAEARLHLMPWSLSEDERYLEMGGLQYQLTEITQDYLRFYLRDYSISGISGKVDVYFMYIRQ